MSPWGIQTRRAVPHWIRVQVYTTRVIQDSQVEKQTADSCGENRSSTQATRIPTYENMSSLKGELVI